MATKDLTTTKTNKPSLLDQFKLGYEYDMTWNDAKKSVRTRTQR